MARLWLDLQFALRNLRRSPLFTFVAVASLALGIGANTAIFTLIDQLMLRLLPVRNPNQLVMIWSTGPHMGSNRGARASSYPMYQDYQKPAKAFSYVFCRFETSTSVSFNGQTERVDAELVSGNYFQALGVNPAAGRVFSPEQDDRVYKGQPSVVLGYPYWMSRFAGDPGVVGRKIIVDNYPMTIVGVSAAGFLGLDPSHTPQIRIPIQMKPLMTPGWDDMGDRRSQWIQMFARLRPGYTLDSAKASLAAALPPDSGRRARPARNARYQRLLPEAFPGAPGPHGSRRHRLFADAPVVLHGPGGVDVHGRAGAADRLLQCGEPADRAGHGAAEGNGGAAGGGRLARPDRDPIADRKPFALRGRRPGRALPRHRHHSDAAAVSSPPAAPR